MRHTHFGAAILIAFVLFAGAATAQKKTTKKPVPKKPPVTLVAPLEVRAAREKVEIQRYNVSGWATKLGPIAQSIEILDKAAAEKRLNKEEIASNEATKQKFIAILKNVREDLSVLESEFRTKPALTKYLSAIEGITDLAAKAEDTAISGKYFASRDPLRTISAKLLDTLTLMPL